MRKAKHRVITLEVYKASARMKNKRVTIDFQEDIVLKARDTLACALTHSSADRYDVEIVVTRADNEPIALRDVRRYADLYNVNIGELGLDVRGWNALNNNHVQTVGALMELSKEDVMKFRNLGDKSARQIEDILSEYGLQLRNRSMNPTLQRLLRGEDDVFKR